jgi:hypothetical protein
MARQRAVKGTPHPEMTEQSLVRARSRGSAIRLAVAGLLAALACAAGAEAAAAAPSLTLSKSSGIDPDGETITITGEGFKGSMPGIYVTFGPKHGDTSNAGAYHQTKWVFPGGTPTEVTDKLNGDGTFSTTLELKARFTDASGKTVDCKVDKCVVRTMAAHGSPDRSQDHDVDVSFGGGTLTVSKTGGLSPAEPTNVTVTGAGFATAGDGVRLAYGPLTDDFNTDTSRYLPSSLKDIPAGDGTINETLTIQPRYEDGNGEQVDCTVTRCYVVAFAQNAADRSQDNFIPIGFGPARITVTPNTALDRNGTTTVTITGEGFASASEAWAGGPPAPPERAGFYVAFGAKRAGYTTSAALLSSYKWVRRNNKPNDAAAHLTVDGRFQTTLPVSRAYTAGGTTIDCEQEAEGCGIMTWTSHLAAGDRSNDTFGQLTFAPVPPPAVPAPQPDNPAPQPQPQPTPPTHSAPPASTPSVARSSVALSTSRLRFRVSEPSRIEVVIRRRVVRRVRRKSKVVRIVRWVKVRTIRVTARRAGTVSVNPRLGRAGQYRITITPRSTATNRRGKALVVVKTVKKPAAAKQGRR